MALGSGSARAAAGGLLDIHCRGCGRTVGVGPADYRLFCDAFCAADFPAGVEEARDAVIVALATEEKHTNRNVNKSRLAREFGLSRQSIHAILDAWEDAA